jgi:hypothetical protein
MFILQLILCCGLQTNLGSTVKKSKIKNPSSSHTQFVLLGPILKRWFGLVFSS